jgi:hypothetical protein
VFETKPVAFVDMNILYEILGIHDGEVSFQGLLGCDTVECCGRIPTFGGPCCLHLQGEVNGTGKRGTHRGM